MSAVRADLDLGQVVDVERRIARLARPQEQRDVVAPGDERRARKSRSRSRPRAMKAANCSGSPALKAIQRSMSTPPSMPGGVHAVVDVAPPRCRCRTRRRRARTRRRRRWQSTTTLARMARRPSLLSNITPRRRAPSSTIGSAAQPWKTSAHAALEHAFPARASFSRSGSIVGDQVTMPWKAAVRCAPVGGRAPDRASPSRSRAGPAIAPRRQAVEEVLGKAADDLAGRSQSVMRSIQITRPPVERPPR